MRAGETRNSLNACCCCFRFDVNLYFVEMFAHALLFEICSQIENYDQRFSKSSSFTCRLNSLMFRPTGWLRDDSVRKYLSNDSYINHTTCIILCNNVCYSGW